MHSVIDAECRYIKYLYVHCHGTKVSTYPGLPLEQGGLHLDPHHHLLQLHLVLHLPLLGLQHPGSLGGLNGVSVDQVSML
jgi:hypothetical protein